MHRHNIFAGPYVDRSAPLRADDAMLMVALADRRARVVPVWRMQSLVMRGDPPRAAFIDMERLPRRHRDPAQLIFLGRFAGDFCFALDVESADPDLVGPDLRFQDLRALAGVLPSDEAGLLAYARAMVWWRLKHRFCGTCGAPTRVSKGGHLLTCTNPQCQTEHFPRTDPAIIVLVTDGERVLLGRQSSWPAGRYSTIAGFVEPGESLEDAVAREVQEETGIEIAEVRYESSQPWPFPSSLMVGFRATARSTEIRLNDEELEDAQWFTRESIAAGVPVLPPSPSISYRLIEDWYDASGSAKLASVSQQHSWTSSR